MATPKQTAPPRRRLGKGLQGLISAPVVVDRAAGEPKAPASVAPGTSPAELPLDTVHPNPTQPRKAFDEASLEALAASIRSAGVMQPIVVRPRSGGGYELVAGERRWRAAQRAGLSKIPAIVREADDRQLAEWSLIENLQREDLNPIERAEAFQRLIDEYALKHQEVGEIVGMDRSSVTNHLRLLEHEESVREVIRAGLLGVGHARALLGLERAEDRRDLALKAAREGWSVRSTEQEIARRTARLAEADPAGADGAPRMLTGRQAHVADLERRLSDHLGTRVRIRSGKRKGSGTISLEFFDSPQFEGLMERLGFSLDG